MGELLFIAIKSNQKAPARNRVRVFFGYFLLPKQKKVPHRQVKSLLSELAAEAKMMLTTKDHQVNECQQLAQSTFPPQLITAQTKEFLCSFRHQIFNTVCTDKNRARLHSRPAILPKYKHTLEKSCFKLVVFYSGESYRCRSEHIRKTTFQSDF